jgi:adenylosuccinate lyase
MARNLEHLGGLVHSQRVLLALTQKGLSREAAYAAVQRNAMKVWRREGAFLDFLSADPEVAGALSPAELAELFDPAWHFAQVDTIFARVFGEDAVVQKAAAE